MLIRYLEKHDLSNVCYITPSAHLLTLLFTCVPQNMTQQVTLSIKQVAESLKSVGISNEVRVRQLARLGMFPNAIKNDQNQWQIPIEDVNEFIKKFRQLDFSSKTDSAITPIDDIVDILQNSTQQAKTVETNRRIIPLGIISTVIALIANLASAALDSYSLGIYERFRNEFIPTLASTGSVLTNTVSITNTSAISNGLSITGTSLITNTNVLTRETAYRVVVDISAPENIRTGESGKVEVLVSAVTGTISASDIILSPFEVYSATARIQSGNFGIASGLSDFREKKTLSPADPARWAWIITASEKQLGNQEALFDVIIYDSKGNIIGSTYAPLQATVRDPAGFPVWLTYLMGTGLSASLLAWIALGVNSFRTKKDIKSN